MRLKAAQVGGVGVEDVDAPALLLGVALVHAVEVGGEQGGFLPAGGGVNLDDDVALVVGVLGQEGDAESLGQVGEAGFNVFQFELGHFDQFGVATLGDEGAEVGPLFDEAVAMHVDGDQVFQTGAFAVQFAQACVISGHLGLGHLGFDGPIPLHNGLQLVENVGHYAHAA